MDKYELKVTINEIDSLIAGRRFAEAADVADTVDWRRVKNVRTLCRISDIYKINKRYEDSKRVLELAYAKSPYGRQIIFSLCELELKLGSYVRALQLYNEYINVAPRDTDRYVLQYKLYKAQNVSVNERIAVLEEMARHDMRGKWAFELAKLYLEAGERNLCASQCDEIIAFFGEGRYVRKALELKASFTELTVKQKALYRKMNGEPEEEEEESSQAPAAEERAADSAVSVTAENAESAQSGEKPPAEDEGAGSTESADSTDSAGPDQGAEAAEAAGREEAASENGSAADPGAEEPAPEPAQEKEELIPDLNRDPGATEIPWEYEDYEIHTKELRKKEPAADKRRSGRPPRASREEGARERDSRSAVKQARPAPDHSVFEDHSFEISPEDEAMFSPENMQKMIAKGLRDLENYDTYLRQETDGQYAMVMQEEKKPEKQITGQLNLEEIMSEWEKVKRDFYESNGLDADEPAQAVPKTSPALYDEKSGSSSMYTKSWDPGEVHKALQIRDDDKEGAAYDTSLFVTEGGGEFPEEFTIEKPASGPENRSRRQTGPIYLHSEDSIRQLSDALGRTLLEGGTGNVVITGDEGAGTLSLARELVRRYRQINPNFVGQIAKSEGRYITRENILRVIPRMPFGALIIERTSMMSEEGAAALCDMLEAPERSILIILIDRKGVMDAFLNDHPRLKEMFTARVDIAALSVDTLLGYAREYAGKQQCEIDEFGMSALQSRVMSMQTVEHSVTLEDIRDIVDEGIYYASRKTISSLVDSFSRRKGGAQNRIVLRDKDFLHY